MRVVIPLTVHWDLRLLFLQICDFSQACGHLLVSFDGLRKKRDCAKSNWHLSFVLKLTIHQVINQLHPGISVTWMHLDTSVKNSMFGFPNTRVWKSIRKSNTQLKQSFIISIVCCLHLCLQFTVPPFPPSWFQEKHLCALLLSFLHLSIDEK